MSLLRVAEIHASGVRSLSLEGSKPCSQSHPTAAARWSLTPAATCSRQASRCGAAIRIISSALAVSVPASTKKRALSADARHTDGRRRGKSLRSTTTAANAAPPSYERPAAPRQRAQHRAAYCERIEKRRPESILSQVRRMEHGNAGPALQTLQGRRICGCQETRWRSRTRLDHAQPGVRAGNPGIPNIVAIAEDA